VALSEPLLLQHKASNQLKNGQGCKQPQDTEEDVDIQDFIEGLGRETCF
jgi:hypothetical protein